MGLECVANVSEGQDLALIERLDAAAAGALIDRHADPDHHRTVFTLAGTDESVEAAARRLAAAAVAAIDIADHDGQHPRIGVVDVVPFVPMVRAAPLSAGGAGSPAATGRLDMGPALDAAVAARDRFARWAWSELGVPCFLYGPLPGGGERSLPEVRRSAFSDLAPDTGGSRPHPTAGACAVGARRFLVAYNLWVAGGDVDLVRAVARAIRGPAVRAIGLDLSGRLQVSCNLVDPITVGPAEVHDRVALLLEAAGAAVDRCELVGLLPSAVLEAVPRPRWAGLGLGPEETIEGRLEERAVSWR